MTNKNKDRLVNVVIGIVTGCSIILFGSFLDDKKEENSATKDDIETLEEEKVSWKDYEKDQKTKWENHDKVQGLRDKREDEMYQMLMHLYQQNNGVYPIPRSRRSYLSSQEDS